MAKLQTQRPSAYDVLGNSSFWGWYYLGLTNKVWTGQHVMGVGSDQTQFAEAYLIRDGVRLANNRASSNTTAIGNGTFTVSGTPTQWGLASATGKDLKSSNLGFQFALKAMEYPGYTTETLRTASIRLTGMNVSFIPDDLAITGIDITIVTQAVPTGGGTYAIQVTDAYLVINATIVLKLNGYSEMRGLMTIGTKQLSGLDTEIVYEATQKTAPF